MCGITLFLSKNDINIIPMIIKSINLIQNRYYYNSHGCANKSRAKVESQLRYHTVAILPIRSGPAVEV